MTPATAQHEVRRRGTALIVTMIVVFALGSLVLTMGRTARVEATASANSAAMLQADAIARGAEQFVLALVTDQLTTLDTMRDSDFAAVQVGTGWFWILRPDYGDPDLPLFGIVDEAGKLDLNRASLDGLRMLPGMTDDLAASIVDWRDGDDTSTEGGAESNVYLSRNPPYRAKNGNFETIEELMLVSGMTRDYLHGGQQPGGRALAFEQHRLIGLFPYVTVWNSQRNVAADGTRRLNIGDNNRRQDLRRLLRQRLGDTRGEEVGSLLGSPNNPPRDLFDLAVRTQMTADELRLVEDYLTSTGSGRLRGLVNVNTAPREVLLCLDGLDEAQADQLLAARPAAVAAYPGTIAWVYDVLQEGAIGLGSQITGRGRQYSADILAVSANGRAFKRIRMVVDASRTTPRIVYRRDLTDGGWPLDESVRDSIRAGRGPGDWSNVGAGMRGRAW